MCIGKWHLGDQRVFLPTRQGFDGYFGIPYSKTWAARPSKMAVGPPLMRDEKVAELFENEGQRRITRAYTEEAFRFITRNRDRRFFLYLPHTAMHVPLFPHKDFAGKSKTAPMVTGSRRSTGASAACSRPPALQLDRNTLVLFTRTRGRGPRRARPAVWPDRCGAARVARWKGESGCPQTRGGPEPSAPQPATTESPEPPTSAHAGRPGRGRPGQGQGETTHRRHRHLADADRPIEDLPRDHWFYYQGTRLKGGPIRTVEAGRKETEPGNGDPPGKPPDLNIDGPRLYNLDKGKTAKRPTGARNIPRWSPAAETGGVDASRHRQWPTGTGSETRRTGQEPRDAVPLTPPSEKNPQGPGKPIAWQTAKPGGCLPVRIGSADRRQGLSRRIYRRAPWLRWCAHRPRGSAVGYSLYIKNQKLTWAVRYGTNSIQRLTTNLPDKPNSRLRASVSPNGLELRVNERKPVVVKRFGVLGRHPQEGLCIGHDNANPVDNQSPRKRFGGKLSGLKVTVGDRLKTGKPDN
ncbi:MAG: hypothetical protein Ct9H300mP1_22310 [Planctomycetaceae bacterium]|nr:MAG: hypothetical protein Ct9H300mP1_22310 [Planctomycetaceae bacterium]